MKVYGIKNCNTMQKAFGLLNDRSINFQFHDYKKLGIDEATLKRWMQKAELARLINRSGLTWKKLDEKEKDSASSEAGAIQLMMSYPSMIKRPIVETGDVLLIGFEELEKAFR
jgi:arsenate reductase